MFLKRLVEAMRTRGAGGHYSLQTFRGDVFGGITAAVVALPLALAFGVASGAGAIAGLYGAIAVGFFASIFGGTPAQVSGPTGPMTVVMGAVVATHADSLSTAFTVVMLGGLLQMIFGLLRIGRYISYTPVSVISGFLSGVGLIILILQLLPFLGLPPTTEGVGGAATALAQIEFSHLNWAAALLATSTLVIVVYWPVRWARVIPSPLAALVLGSAAGYMLLPELPTIGPIPTGLPQFVVPDISFVQFRQILQPAFILALLGSIDSLLTSLVSDSLTRTRHDSNRELIGQGIGNMVAGFAGAIPGAGATMRTVVNIRAGGRTRVSGALHAAILLVLALGLGQVVSYIPNAVLAAILMKVGWDIIDWSYIGRVRQLPTEKVVVMLVTLVLTIFVDLITAVAVGIILASFVSSRGLAAEQLKGLKQSADSQLLDELSPDERAALADLNGRILMTSLRGAFSYASARELARRDIQKDYAGDVVIYDLSGAGYVDPSAAMAIDEMVELSRSRGRHVLIAGLGEQAYRALRGMRVLDRIPPGQIFPHRHQAVEAAAAYCRKSVPAPAAPVINSGET